MQSYFHYLADLKSLARHRLFNNQQFLWNPEQLLTASVTSPPRPPTHAKTSSLTAVASSSSSSSSSSAASRLQNGSVSFNASSKPSSALSPALPSVTTSPAITSSSGGGGGGCLSCAVVGGGGGLVGSRQGASIDGHDLVFRVNVALTKGFERDVGTKMNLYMSYPGEIVCFFFSRVLSDSTSRFVGPSVGPSVRLSVGPSVTLYFSWVFAVFGLTAPAQMIW